MTSIAQKVTAITRDDGAINGKVNAEFFYN